MSKYLDKARELRAITERHYNCAQSVIVPFADVIGMDEEMAYRMGANFGGGMKMGSVCGALTGALMVLGLAGLDDVSMLQELYKKMKDNHEGCLNCADLLRINAQKGLPKKPHCDDMVYELVGYTEELLRGAGKIS